MSADYNTPNHVLMALALQNGLVGCHLDADGVPEWARRSARRARDEFREKHRPAEELVCQAAQGRGRGKRAVNFQHAMHLDRRILTGAQDYNNCTAWCFRAVAGCAIATELMATGRTDEYKSRPGTAGIYSYRGSRADSGMAIYLGAMAISEKGIGYEINYPGVADLSTEAADEHYGVSWGGSGPPAVFRGMVADNLIGETSEVTDEDAIMDILYAGHFIGTGSTLTASATGDPVSTVRSIGGHAQALIGYDDSDEFRAWYAEATGKRLSTWVGIFDQSWPPSACTRITNWPEHLWGPMPDGAFVLAGPDVMRIVDTKFGAAIACSSRKEYPILDLKPWKEVLGWL